MSSLKIDLRNAGAHWTDAPVVVDGNLVTSRKPSDLPAFVGALERLLADGAGPGEIPGSEAPVETASVSEARHNVQEEPGSQSTG